MTTIVNTHILKASRPETALSKHEAIKWPAGISGKWVAPERKGGYKGIIKYILNMREGLVPVPNGGGNLMALNCGGQGTKLGA